METKTRILIGLGAAAAANCIPCFRHYFKKAGEASISNNDVMEAVELGLQMKGGASLDMKNNIHDIVKAIKPADRLCDCLTSTPSCCC
jgi:alkylhydroperoxidase/carboxymuconolactone decarboxylase family protein YurZ